MVAVVVRWTSATGFFGLGWWPLWLRRADAAVQTSGVWCVVCDAFVVRYRLGRAVANGYAQDVARGADESSGKSSFSR